MSAFAEKLLAAGADTVGAEFTTACVEAIKRHPGSVVDAWRFAGAVFGHDFVRGLMNDMHKNMPVTGEPASRIPGKPLRSPQERMKERNKIRQFVRSKYKNGAGVAWSDVGWHELTVLARDGKEAGALLAACSGGVPNDGRTVGDVLGVKRVDEIIKAARS